MRGNKLMVALALGGALFTGLAQAQTPAAKPGPGPGPGYGQGYGQGGCPGMDGGYGMMGGGMGPGMMGGMGMLPYGIDHLALTDQQRNEIGKIQDEQQRRHLDTMKQALDLHTKMRGLYAQDNWDANAIINVENQMQKLHEQMIRSKVDAHNRIMQLLTPAQRAALHNPPQQ